MGGFSLGLGLVVEDRPTELSYVATCITVDTEYTIVYIR